MKTGMTAQQAELLKYIRDFSEREGHAPSFEEMMSALGLGSKSSVHRLVTALHERGLIRRIPGRARCVEVINQSVRFSSAAEVHIKAYCQRNRASREEAVAVAVESYFAGQT